MGILANRKGFRISGAESVKERWGRLELAGLEARATGGAGQLLVVLFNRLARCGRAFQIGIG